MARTRFDDWPCSVARTVDLVGDPWTLLVLRDAFYGVRRFEQFQANLELARNVLAKRLASLVEAGIFVRVPYQERPLRHEYRLTEKGRALYDVVLAMMRFGDDWLAPDGAPIALRSKDDGHLLRPVVVDESTGDRIDPRSVRAERGPGFPDEHRRRADDEGRFES
ncbi:MAG: helix-turn-helix domain-containing protein [Myxococcota bacterium]